MFLRSLKCGVAFAAFAAIFGCVDVTSPRGDVLEVLPIAGVYTRDALAQFLVVNRSSSSVRWRDCDVGFERRVPNSVRFDAVKSGGTFCGSGTDVVGAGEEIIISRRVPADLPPGDYRLALDFAASFEPMVGPTGTAVSTIFEVR